MEDTRKGSSPNITATYTEYVSGNDVIAFIVDADNDRAWVQSTVAVPVER
ncbi:hypothetical protein [Halegenticoccus tardaugens]|nr:hypothetical protein [Halegenticoccus tardaugens]